MKTRTATRLFAQIGVLVAIAALGAWLSMARERAPLINAGLTVDPERLDVGEVWQQSDFQVDLPIENPTTHEITIAKFEASCNCTSVEPETLTIPPHGWESVRVTIDLSHTKATQPDSYTTPFQISVVPRIQADYPVQRQAWIIRGTVRHQFLPPSPKVDLGEHLLGEMAGPEQQIVLRCHPTITELTAAIDPELATVRVLRDEENPSIFTVGIKPSANWPEGVVTRDINLNAFTKEGQTLPPVRLAMSARILGHVAVSPPGLSLGIIAPGSTATQRIILSSRTGNPFVVSHIDVPVEEVTVTRETAGDEARDSVAYLVSVTPHSSGPGTAKVRFTVEPFARWTTEVTLPVSWYVRRETDDIQRP